MSEKDFLIECMSLIIMYMRQQLDTASKIQESMQDNISLDDWNKIYKFLQQNIQLNDNSPALAVQIETKWKKGLDKYNRKKIDFC